jgi:hypothetical protein
MTLEVVRGQFCAIFVIGAVGKAACVNGYRAAADGSSRRRNFLCNRTIRNAISIAGSTVAKQ